MSEDAPRIVEAEPGAPYIERDDQQVLRAPHVWSHMRFHGFVVAAKAARLQERVDRYLNHPLGAHGKHRRYRVTQPWVLFYFSDVLNWAAEDGDRGFFTKRRAGVWIPITCDAWEGGHGFHPSYEFIDSGVARSTERELYGSPTDFGYVTMGEEAVGMQTPGGFQIHGSPPGYSISCSLVDEERPSRVAQQVQLLRVLNIPGSATDAADGTLPRPHEILVRLVQLKQFRAVFDSRYACCQRVTEIPLRAKVRAAAFLPGRFQMHIKDVASYPMIGAYGLDPARMRDLSGIGLDITDARTEPAAELSPAPPERLPVLTLRDAATPVASARRVRRPSSRATPGAAFPPYIDENGGDALPGPFVGGNVRFYGFPLHADVNAIQDLCDRFFVEPTGGATTYRALLPTVMFYFALMREASSADSVAGGVLQYNEGGAWIPMMRVEDGEAKYPCIFPMFTFLDSALAGTTGREVYGWYKELAHMVVPPSPSGGGFLVRPTVLDQFSADTLAESETLLSMGPVFGSRSSPIRSMFDLAGMMLEGALNLRRSGVRVGTALLADLAMLKMPRFAFLKQFRHARYPQRTSYQAVVEADFVLERMRTLRPLPGKYDLLINDYASHPFAKVLGLTSSHLEKVTGFLLDMDFTFRNGEVVWPAPNRTAR